jgi:hypothetical protein
MFMANKTHTEGEISRSRYGGGFNDLRVDARDRIGDAQIAEESGRATLGWLKHILIPVAYFAPALGLLLPFKEPKVGISAVAVIAVGSAAFAFFCLDRREPQRLRLMIFGLGVASTFAFYMLKDWLKL